MFLSPSLSRSQWYFPPARSLARHEQCRKHPKCVGTTGQREPISKGCWCAFGYPEGRYSGHFLSISPSVPTTFTTASDIVYMNRCLPQWPCLHWSSLLAGILPPSPTCWPSASTTQPLASESKPQTGAQISNSEDKHSQVSLPLLPPTSRCPVANKESYKVIQKDPLATRERDFVSIPLIEAHPECSHGPEQQCNQWLSHHKCNYLKVTIHDVLTVK